MFRYGEQICDASLKHKDINTLIIMKESHLLDVWFMEFFFMSIYKHF